LSPQFEMVSQEGLRVELIHGTEYQHYCVGLRQVEFVTVRIDSQRCSQGCRSRAWL
jgi:hypothetical protein